MSRLLVLQHLERESPGLYLRIAEERGMHVKIFRLDLGDPLPELLKGDLLLILGGPMGIRDIQNRNYPWMRREVNLIKEALEKQIALIGVCLGAQLLAHAAGGGIETLLCGSNLQPLPEVGWEPIYSSGIRKNEPLAKLLEEAFYTLHWHGDRILLPDSAELIASSNRCKEQLFKVGPIAYGLQFHIETVDDMVFRWIEEDQEFIRSALGIDAGVILRKQQQDFGKETLQCRLVFLRRIFELIGF